MEQQFSDMRSLVDYLNKTAYAYYTLDEPLISDAEWDRLYNRLLAMEQETGQRLPDSPTRRVGGEPLAAFRQHRPVFLPPQAQDAHSNRLRQILQGVRLQPALSAVGGKDSGSFPVQGFPVLSDQGRRPGDMPSRSGSQLFHQRKQLHPQAVAPGYQMYTCWMIRHIDGNPWLQTDRCEDERYVWLHDAKFE